MKGMKVSGSVSRSAGLLEDKNRYRMCGDGRCVLCNSDEGEDVEHFVLECEEFMWRSI